MYTYTVERLVVLLATATALAVVPVSLSTQCEQDHECGRDEYCYKTKECGKCLDCETWYHRVSPAKHLCIKSADDCGGCLTGYVDEYYSDHNKKHLCAIDVAANSGETTGDSTSYRNTYIYIIGCVALVIVVTFAIFCFCKKSSLVRWLKRFRDGAGDAEDPNEVQPSPPPPPYSELNPLMPSAPLASGTNEQSPSASICVDIDHPAEQCMQKAVPFNKPQAPYYSSEDDGDAEDVDESPSSNHAPPSPDIHDEDTVPSSWVPGNAMNESLPNDSGISDDSTAPNSTIQTPCCGSETDIRSAIESSTLNFAGRLTTLTARRPASPDTARSGKRQRRDSGQQSQPDEERGTTITNITQNVSINILHNN